jgi:hypothetical protein
MPTWAAASRMLVPAGTSTACLLIYTVVFIVFRI